MVCDLFVGSLNVRGINNPQKRRSIFKWVTKNNFDVTLLQETYSSKDNELEWNNEWKGHIVFSHGSKHSKGTMIMFRKGFDFVIKREKCDTSGRFIILEIEIEGHTFIIVNVYAPNKEGEKKRFFSDILNILKSMNITSQDQLIFGGDWNSIFDANLDKAGGKHISANVVGEMKSVIDELDISDIWRIKYPTSRRYTFRQKTPLIQTRLDYFLISSSCQDLVNSVDIIPSVWSDHSAIIMKLKFLKEWPKGKGHWKFNASYLEDEHFVDEMNTKIEEWLNIYKDITDKRVQWELIKYEIRKFCINYGTLRKRNLNIHKGNL